MGHDARRSTACLGGRWAEDLVDVTDDPAVLDGTGKWAVVLPYAGRPVFLRFATWRRDPPGSLDHARWIGPAVNAWASSMSRDSYLDAVEGTQRAIAAGTVYQANICRILAAELPEHEASMAGLFQVLQAGNPAPYGGYIDSPEAGVMLATASPELFLARDGDLVRTGPIKGTASTIEDLQPKDWAENVMIVDLMRNDLGRVCQVGSVQVPSLTAIEQHPGLVHLVSEVAGRLKQGTSWRAIIEATFPPGSVTGAPKSSALRLIAELEPTSREVYCGALGWVDADRRQACLAVAIRTFWYRDGVLRFGTGAGITWGSLALTEWGETQLKARRLIAVAGGDVEGGMAGFDA